MSIPVHVIDASGNFAVAKGFFNPAGFGQGSAPFRAGTDLWCPLNGLGIAFLTPTVMFHSTDNGVTWAQEDAANGPISVTGKNCGLWWDSARYLWAVDNDPSTNFLQLKKFDTVTKLWSASFAVGGPQISDNMQLLIRSDSKVWVLHVSASDSRNHIAQWDGAAWTDIGTFDDNSSSSAAYLSTAVWIDSLDRIHVLGQESSSFAVGMTYQRINADGTLGPFCDLLAAGKLNFNLWPPENFSITLNPTEDTVVIGAVTGAYGVGCKPCLLTGTPLSGLGAAINWTLGPGLDGANDHALYPLVYFDGAHPAMIYQHIASAGDHDPDTQRIGAGSPMLWQDIGSAIPPNLLFPALRVYPTEMMGAYGGWEGDGVNFWRSDIPFAPPVALRNRFR